MKTSDTMFRRLHLQMTIFSTLVTGAILIAMTLICLYIAESGARKSSFASFSENAGFCIIHLEGQTILSHQWILQTQNTYGIRMEIRDNGKPLFFNKLHPSELQEVFQEAARISREEYALDPDSFQKNSAITKSTVFPMKNYYACTALIPKSEGTLSLILLWPMDSLNRQLTSQRLAFAAAVAAAILALGVFSWFFTRKMIRPLEESRRAQTEFIASASHELRSPLAVIQSGVSAVEQIFRESAQALPGESGISAQAPAESSSGPAQIPAESSSGPAQAPAESSSGPAQALPELQRFFSVISRESFRMSRLIDDMLTLANADNHSWKMNFAPCELDTLLLETYDDYRFSASEKKLRLEISLPDEELPRINCDASRISQVLSILLDNALSYVPEGGTITLSLKYENSRFLLSVSDNGPGIPDAQKADIFRRFYRADASRTDKQHFGLGLSIAREIISLHQGTLTVRDAPGGGADFLITLPK